MNATTIQLNESVAAFAAAVREQLDDLTTEQIEDLTDGLEADLAEGAVDRSSAFEPGDALEYASELRSAAGLPPRKASRSRRVAVTRSMTSWRADAARRVRSSAFGAGLLDFLIALRPVWWVLRGWSVGVFAGWFNAGRLELVPTHPALAVVYALLITVSVQWGRGKWMPYTWLKVVRVVISVIAVLALWTISINVIGNTFGPHSPEVTERDLGLWLDGERVGNIFAYDAAGKPLDYVQLFNQRGEPLTTVGHLQSFGEYAWGYEGHVAPPTTSAGPTDWNVFPLFLLDQRADLDPRYSSAPRLPFAAARPLAGAEGLVQTCEAPPEAELSRGEE